MRKTFLLFLWVTIGIWQITTAQPVATPDVIYGELFREVQMQSIFPDSKTFVDCLPKRNPKDIMQDYSRLKGASFDLKKFVEENFELPRTPQLNYITKEKDVVMHIKNLWGVLTRKPDIIVPAIAADSVFNPLQESSLLPLPFPYVVPGGRFRELYYWDSYFTMLGLRESGETEMIENMVKNFAFLIEKYGHIPNGNRTYYLSRSQPPFFALMVDMLAGLKGNGIYVTYLPALEKEYQYWMAGAAKLKAGQQSGRVVKMPDGSVLNRYWDDNPVPRQESYKEDVTLATKTKRANKDLYANLRAGAASGWDYSSRWFADKKNIGTIRITDMIPVDLNCLLYQSEVVLAKANLISRRDSLGAAYRKKADSRRLAIDKYCWNKTLRYYTDYNSVTRKPTDMVTPAGLFPFCVFDRNMDYLSLLARKVSDQVREKLLQPGGLVATPETTTQQWDAPNGWAPLQWMAVWGLDRCGQKDLARDIATRWIKLNVDVFNRTGKLMEKYNVTSTDLEAGGGEYPSQDGFGWTNGVLLALITKYGMPKE
ncbi:MAG: alpha,alpha-trehalase TreF [Chitinophagaceae bacterium]